MQSKNNPGNNLTTRNCVHEIHIHEIHNVITMTFYQPSCKKGQKYMEIRSTLIHVSKHISDEINCFMIFLATKWNRWLILLLVHKLCSYYLTCAVCRFQLSPMKRSCPFKWCVNFFHTLFLYTHIFSTYTWHMYTFLYEFFLWIDNFHVFRVHFLRVCKIFYISSSGNGTFFFHSNMGV